MATPKNVVYDSRNDTSTGRKRAVELTGGVSVAERARLFGTQITRSTAVKNPKLEQPPVNNPPTRSNIVHQDRNREPPKVEVYRYPKQETSRSPPQRVPNNYRPPPVQTNDRPKREQLSSNNTTRPHRQQYNTLPKQTPHNVNYTQTIPSESYTSDDDLYIESFNRPKPSLPAQETNYFQPIQDPLEALYRNSSQMYSQQPIPMAINNNNNNIDGMQPFDLGNLINRIQEDYVNNVRPYVSSIQFIENEQSLANIGFLTPATNRKDYSRRMGGPSYQYDVIDTNGFYPRYTKSSSNYNNYSSMKRRKHRRKYHDQASSPIHILQSFSPLNPPKSQSVTPIQKPPTPVVESSSEEETTTVNTKAEESKTTEVESSSESEDETSAPMIKIETPITQRNEIARPPIAIATPTTVVRPPPKESETESSESEESDSDSDSDSDDDKKAKPSPALRSNNPGTTPQTTTRAIPQRTITKNTDQPPESSNAVNSFDVQNSKKSSAIGSKFKSITNKFRRKKSS